MCVGLLVDLLVVYKVVVVLRIVVFAVDLFVDNLFSVERIAYWAAGLFTRPASGVEQLLDCLPGHVHNDSSGGLGPVFLEKVLENYSGNNSEMVYSVKSM